MSKAYDATQEHKPFEKSNTSGHPRPRTGSTAKRLKRRASREAEVQTAPAKKKK